MPLKCAVAKDYIHGTCSHEEALQSQLGLESYCTNDVRAKRNRHKTTIEMFCIFG